MRTGAGSTWDTHTSQVSPALRGRDYRCTTHDAPLLQRSAEALPLSGQSAIAPALNLPGFLIYASGLRQNTVYHSIFAEGIVQLAACQYRSDTMLVTVCNQPDGCWRYRQVGAAEIDLDDRIPAGDTGVFNTSSNTSSVVPPAVRMPRS